MMYIILQESFNLYSQKHKTNTTQIATIMLNLFYVEVWKSRGV